MAHFLLRNACVGNNIQSVYYLEQLAERTAKNGNKFTDITLRDRSGTLEGKFWGVLENVSVGGFIDVVLTIQEYQGKINFIAESIQGVDHPIDISNYVSVSETKTKDIEKFNAIVDKVKVYSKELNNPLCSRLLEKIFSPEEAQSFYNAPYGTLPFYGRVGGLLAHTVKVSYAAFELSKPYSLDVREKSVLLTASLLHAVGAKKAYETKNLVAKDTVSGLLLGRTILSLNIIETALNSIAVPVDNINKLDLRIKHAVVASDFNSGIKPMTKEAVVLYEACKSDYNIVEAFDFISLDKSNEEFTAYDPVLRRRYFKG